MHGGMGTPRVPRTSATPRGAPAADRPDQPGNMISTTCEHVLVLPRSYCERLNGRVALVTGAGGGSVRRCRRLALKGVGGGRLARYLAAATIGGRDHCSRMRAVGFVADVRSRRRSCCGRRTAEFARGYSQSLSTRGITPPAMLGRCRIDDFPRGDGCARGGAFPRDQAALPFPADDVLGRIINSTSAAGGPARSGRRTIRGEGGDRRADEVRARSFARRQINGQRGRSAWRRRR